LFHEPEPVLNVQNQETIPNIRFEADGKLHPDSAAAAAIKGLPPGELTDKLAALEEQYNKLLDKKPDLMVRFARFLMGYEEPVLEIIRLLRAQVAALAIAHQELLLDQKQKGLRETFGAEYHRICEEQSKFRGFMKRWFEYDMAMAEELNKPLLDVAKDIMLRALKAPAPERIADPQAESHQATP
jgi:hypothetical protein